MDRMLVGNILGLLGSTMMSLAGIVKDKKRLLLVMCVCYVVAATNATALYANF